MKKAREDDAGLGLIEIVVSMFLIALLAIAFVPVLVASLRASDSNSTVATATRFVSQTIDSIRAREITTCGDLETAVGDATQAQADTGAAVQERRGGVQIFVETTTRACDAEAANLIVVQAFDEPPPPEGAPDTRTPIAEARTLVLVRAVPAP